MLPTSEAAPDGPRHRASRLSAILDLLATRGGLSVSAAASELDVSEATIRRDFAELSRRQLVTRNHGGVVATSVAYELPYSTARASTTPTSTASPGPRPPSSRPAPSSR